jgi:tetratricopeptide (TPR) repeat protein
MKIPEEGDIRDYSIPTLFIQLNRHRRTGTLLLTNQGIRKGVYFVNGEIVFARSHTPGDRLDDMLLRKGMITEQQYQKVSEVYERTRRRKGTILVELGFIDPQDLFTIIREHVREIILGLFEWQAGRFRFIEGMPSVEVVTLRNSIREIIAEGMKRAKQRKRPRDPFMERLDELYRRMENANHYELLGVNTDAPYSEIKRAYHEKVKEFHPDRHRDIKDPLVKEKLTNILARINEAYNTLKEEKQRGDYNRDLTRDHDNPATRKTTAMEYFINGIDEYRRGNFWGAAELFKRAAHIEPRNAKYWAHLSLSLVKMPRRAKDAEIAILKAIDLDPYNINYHIHLGRLYLNMGMRLRARSQFEKALSIDPDNMRVREELERLRVSR